MNYTQEAKQPRPRWALIRDLKRMSYQGSTAFFTWFWGLSEQERKIVMAG